MAVTNEDLKQILPALYRKAYLLCGNRHDAEDLVQATVVKILPRLSEVDKNLGAYATRAVVTTFLNMLRSRDREASMVRTVTARPPAVGHDIAEGVAVTADLAQRLRQLDPLTRAVVVLRYYDDRSVGDTARMLDRPEGTIRRIAHRAVHELRLAHHEEMQ